jgi:hypothetical protein
VEPVPADAFFGICAGQGDGLRQPGLSAVERRVEARDLGQIGPELCESPDRGEVVRPVERCEGDELLEIGQDLRVDRSGLAVLQTAVDDAVARHVKPAAALRRLDLGGPSGHVFDGALVPQARPLGPFGLGDSGAGLVADEEPGRCEQPLRLSAEHHRSSPEWSKKTKNFRLEEPAFRTAMVRSMVALP